MNHILQTVNPAMSCFLISLLCLLEALRIMPAFSGTLMAIQFIVVHSSVFIFAIPLINNEKVKPFVFTGLLAIYTIAAFSVDGLFGIIQFWGLTYSTYYGYSFGRGNDGEKSELVIRWITALVLFLTAIIICGAPENVDNWPSDRRLALGGAFYFLGLGCMELSGFYREGWKKLARKIIEKDPAARDRQPAWLIKTLYNQPPAQDEDKKI